MSAVFNEAALRRNDPCVCTSCDDAYGRCIGCTDYINWLERRKMRVRKHLAYTKLIATRMMAIYDTRNR